MLLFLKKTLFNTWIILLLYILYIYTNIYFTFGIFVLFTLSENYILSNNIDERTDLTDEIKNKYDINTNRTRVLTSDQSIGEAVPRLLRKDIIILPSEISDEDRQVVLFHEYYHILKKHKYKYELLRFVGMSFVLCFIIFVPIKNIFLIIIQIIVFSCIINYTLNIYRHKIEYETDLYASKKISTKKVINRLRKNTHHEIDKNYNKYFYTYPRIIDRIQYQMSHSDKKTLKYNKEKQ